MTNTTATPKIHPTREAALHLARCYVVLAPGGPVTHDEIANLMYDEQMCTMHAAHVVFTQAYAEGRIPTDTCSLCGGRNYAGQGDHNMCIARSERGLPTSLLDVVESRHCGCYDCEDRNTGALAGTVGV